MSDTIERCYNNAKQYGRCTLARGHEGECMMPIEAERDALRAALGPTRILMALLADWERINGTLAAITRGEFAALVSRISHWAETNSARSISETLSNADQPDAGPMVLNAAGTASYPAWVEDRISDWPVESPTPEAYEAACTALAAYKAAREQELAYLTGVFIRIRGIEGAQVASHDTYDALAWLRNRERARVVDEYRATLPASEGQS